MNLMKVLLLGVCLLVAVSGQAQTDYLEKGASNRKVLAMGLYPAPATLPCVPPVQSGAATGCSAVRTVLQHSLPITI